MASAKFLEEALSTDVDESAVSAIVGSLENQLAPPVANAAANATTLNQNHVNSAISNGGSTALASHKHGAIANGDTINSLAGSASTTADGSKTSAESSIISSSGSSSVNIIFTTTTPTMSSTGAIIANRSTFPMTQTIPNGSIASQANAGGVQTIQSKQQQQQQQPPTLVIKTNATAGAATGNATAAAAATTSTGQGLVTLPMNVTANVPQVNNVGSHTSTPANPNILSNLQVVNVRPGIPTHPQKGQPARVVLSAPHLVGARPGTPQLTLQSLQGLQPGQQGHLLLKTENGQYQLLRVGPAPASGAAASIATNAGAGVTFRMHPVPAQAVTTQITNATTVVAAPAAAPTSTTPAVVAAQPPPPAPVASPSAKPANDNTKEKCRKFLANLLELSSREPKPVEKNVRTLIQDLIDMKVEPEDFCDRLERLLNASPQPCLIGFLKKSLPLLRHSLAMKEMSIDGIRPPAQNAFTIVNSSTVQSPMRPSIPGQQVRLVPPGTTLVRPSIVQQQRVGTPIRSALPQTRMVATIRQPTPAGNAQLPALHPVYNPNRAPGVNAMRPSMVRKANLTTGPGGHVMQQAQMLLRTTSPATKSAVNVKTTGQKPLVPSNVSKLATKEKEKKNVSSGAASAAAAAVTAYAGDDDINDVAAMGGVNLAEETQRILGSTEFVGTQIRSCKEEFFLGMNVLHQRIRKAVLRHGLDDAGTDVAAAVSHATQERLKNIVEKLVISTEHRLEMVKNKSQFELTSDVKGQLKFLEELDKNERKRHEEIEREMLLRAAKSRSKTEDPEQAKLKAKAKEMQRVEMEELRQREANATALQAIGPRKKPKMENDLNATAAQTYSGLSGGARGHLPLKQRMKKVTLRDLQYMCEKERDLCRSTMLYSSYLK